MAMSSFLEIHNKAKHLQPLSDIGLYSFYLIIFVSS